VLYYHQVSKHDRIISVGDSFSIPWSWLTIRAYLLVVDFIVVLNDFLQYHYSNSFLLLHFTISVAILAVILHILVPFIRAESNCRFKTVYTGWVERTRSNQTHIPSRSISERFATVRFDSLHAYIKPEIGLVRNRGLV